MARPQVVTDEQIISAASRVVARIGPDAFSLSAVAREVGVTRGAITFRFKSARDLKLHSMRLAVAEFAQFMAQLDLERSGDGLLALARHVASLLRGQLNLNAFWSQFHRDIVDPEFLALQEERGRLLYAAIVSVMPPTAIEQEAAASLFNAHLTGTLMAWLGGDACDPEAFVVQCTKDWLRLAGLSFQD